MCFNKIENVLWCLTKSTLSPRGHSSTKSVEDIEIYQSDWNWEWVWSTSLHNDF